MKKFLFFSVFSFIVIAMSVQTMAAPIEINGELNKTFSSDQFTDTINALDFVLSGKLSLELELTLNNSVLKAGVLNLGNDPELNYTRYKSEYIEFTSPVISLWFAHGINPNYQFTSLGDPMYIGSSIVNLYDYYEDSVPVWKDSYKYETLYWYDYSLKPTLIPKFQSNLTFNLGKLNLTANYNRYIVSGYSGPFFSISDPLSFGIFESDECSELLSTFMLRGTFNVNKYLNLGISFINLNTGAGSSCSTEENLNLLEVDLSGENAYIGGNYTLAFLATLGNSDPCGGGCNDNSIFASNGMGIRAALNDIPIGKKHQFKLDIDFTAVQEYDGCSLMCLDEGWIFGHYDSTAPYPGDSRFKYNSLRFGATLRTTVDLEQAGYIDLSLSDYFSSHFPEALGYYLGCPYNTLSLEADLNTPKGSNANLITVFRSDLESSENDLFIGAKAGIVVNDNFTINSRSWFETDFSGMSYISFAFEIGAIGKWALPVNPSVSAADFTIGAMGSLSTIEGMPYNKALIYMELNSTFTNKLGLNMAVYADNNVKVKYPDAATYEYHNPSLTEDDAPLTFVATVTGSYSFTEKLSLSATGTYRNWEIGNGFHYHENSSGSVENNEISCKYIEIADNFFFALALNYEFSNSSNITLSWGRNGLADKEITDPAKYPNSTVYPWMKVAIAPRYGEMSWKTVKLSFNIKF